MSSTPASVLARALRDPALAAPVRGLLRPNRSPVSAVAAATHPRLVRGHACHVCALSSLCLLTGDV